MIEPVVARTILAVTGHGSWWLDTTGTFLPAPYVDHDGTPLVLVDHASSVVLLEQARVSVTLRPASTLLGSLHLSGRPRMPRAAELDGELDIYRRNHAQCGSSCGARGTVPIAIDVSRVALAAPRQRRFFTVALNEFRTARSDPWTVAAHAVAEHIGSAHPVEVLQLAAQVAGIPPGDMLSATIADITPNAVVLTAIDDRGAADIEVYFDRPVASTEELLDALHRMMCHPAAPDEVRRGSVRGLQRQDNSPYGRDPAAENES